MLDHSQNAALSEAMSQVLPGKAVDAGGFIRGYILQRARPLYFQVQLPCGVAGRLGTLRTSQCVIAFADVARMIAAGFRKFCRNATPSAGQAARGSLVRGQCHATSNGGSSMSYTIFSTPTEPNGQAVHVRIQQVRTSGGSFYAGLRTHTFRIAVSRRKHRLRKIHYTEISEVHRTPMTSYRTFVCRKAGRGTGGLATHAKTASAPPCRASKDLEACQFRM